MSRIWSARTVAAWLLVVAGLAASSQSGCWLSREYHACSRNQDCAVGEICFENALGSEPIRVCIPADEASVADGGADAIVDAGGAADVSASPDADASDRDVLDEADATGLAPPTGLSASDGTHAGFVHLTWQGATTATYRIIRDGAEIAANVAGTSWDDENAVVPVPSNDGLDLIATEDRADGVALTWDEPRLVQVHEYRVVSEINGQLSEPSGPDDGFRAAPALSRYDLQVDGGDWMDVGLSRSFLDSSAPAGALVDAGAVVASDGSSPFEVSLSLDGIEISPGAARSYRVRAVSLAGTGIASEPVTGYRGAALAYTWQRSSESEALEFEDIGTTEVPSFDDVGAPVDGRARSYRCQVEDGLGNGDTSEEDAGFRQIFRIEAAEVAGDGAGAVASVGEWLVIGAAGANEGEGVVRVFSFDGEGGWAPFQTIAPPEEHVTASFGAELALTAEWLVVGAAFANSQRGEVYVYQFVEESWEFVEVLAPDDTDAGDRFGYSLAIDGDNLFVGAPGADSSTTPRAGIVFAYRLEDADVVEQDVIEYVGANERADFGYAVAADDGWMMVGAPRDLDSEGKPNGLVLVYRASGADEASTWERVDAEFRGNVPDDFGASLTIEGALAAVGAPHAGSVVNNTGKVVLLHREELDGIPTWVRGETLLAELPINGGGFGHALALEGDRIVVAAPTDLDEQGSVHLFELSDDDGWIGQQLLHPTQQPEALYGWDVVLNDRWVLVGAPLADTTLGEDAGSVFLYALSE